MLKTLENSAEFAQAYLPEPRGVNKLRTALSLTWGGLRYFCIIGVLANG